jgi:hypothetical protein
MKKLLTLVIAAVLTLAVGAISYAQDAGPQGGQIESRQHHGGGGGGLKMMMQAQHDVLAGMHLSDDKMKKIDTLNKVTVDEMKAFRKANKGTDKKDLAEKHKAMMKKYQDSMRDILGSDWKTYRQKMEAKMKELRDERKDKKGGD